MEIIHLSSGSQAATSLIVVPRESDPPCGSILLHFERQASEFWKESVIFTLTREEAKLLVEEIRQAFDDVPF